MSKEILLDMKNEFFTGNVLDIGFKNYGVIYKLCNNKEDVEYISCKGEKEYIQKGFYDTCILFFTLSDIWLYINKNILLKEICNYLKDDGVIYIWDIDKFYIDIFNHDLKIILPEKRIKTIKIKDYNIFKNSSQKTIVNLVKKYFTVIDLKSSNNIYCIKGIKKRSNDNEGSTSRN